MNKIIREHYPVANLPEDLREGLTGHETVKIVIEEDGGLTGLAAVEAAERKYQNNLLELRARVPADFGAHRGSVTIEEAVARIRALRDEWDD